MLGVAETFLYGAYVGLLLALIYNWVTQPAGAGRRNTGNMRRAAESAATPTTWLRTLQETVVVAAAPSKVFAWIDDPRNTGMHMSRPSMAMLGGMLRLEQLSPSRTGVGTTYRSWGRVLGLPIDCTTMVTAWEPDREKTWRTTGRPRLIVLGNFEMRFTLVAVDHGTRLILTISYSLPPAGFGRLLGRMLAAPYARWCLRQMVRDARIALGSVA